jgi:hypothetical protein
MAMKLEHSRWMRHWLLTAGVIVLLAAPSIYGCGPWFDEAVFIPGGVPQTSQPEFAAGKLGILLPTMRRSYLIVAYRYLSGMKLTADQQREAIDVWNRNMAPTPPPFADQHPASDAWLKARERVEGVAQLEPLHSDIWSGGTSHQEGDPITSTAKKTLIVIPRSLSFDRLQMV